MEDSVGVVLDSHPTRTLAQSLFERSVIRAESETSHQSDLLGSGRHQRGVFERSAQGRDRPIRSPLTNLAIRDCWLTINPQLCADGDEVQLLLELVFRLWRAEGFGWPLEHGSSAALGDR